MRARFIRVEIECDGEIYGAERNWDFFQEERGDVQYMLEEMIEALNKKCPDGLPYKITKLDTGIYKN